MDPLTLFFILAVAGGGLYYASQNASAATDSGPSVAPIGIRSLAVYINTRFGFQLWDVDPSAQKGSFKIDFDDSFLSAAKSTGVPFALLKAHAIRESSLNSSAARTEPSGKKSYGLMQILWWPNSNRFAQWGYNDDKIGDGSILYDPDVNCYIGGMIAQDNLSRLDSLDDAINAYNTGVAVSVRVAPGNYVADVKRYYSTLIGQAV